MTLADRFWAKVDQRRSDDCWPWTAGKDNATGYGRFRGEDESESAHRTAYRLTYGEVPAGLQVDHTCHNADESCAGGPTCPHRACCNPAHLEAVTHAENVARGRSGARYAKRTHCPRGLEYSAGNTYVNPKGSRVCRECKNDGSRADYHRDKQRTSA